MRTPFAVAAILALLPAAVLGADEWKADPPGTWRKMTWEDETTTSKCLGSLTTPICAVENKKACYVRERNDLCQLAVEDGGSRTFIHTNNGHRNVWYAYRFSKVRMVKTGENITVGDEVALVGDYLVDLRSRQCFHDIASCEKDIGPATTHLVRKFGNEWRIITWSTPRW